MQNYSNHTRYFPIHHFVLTPLTLIVFIWTIIRLFSALQLGEGVSDALLWLLTGIILFLLPLVSRIYALKNQNRIIRMEMRLRYFHLTGQSFDQMEYKLSLSQVIALRFAGDEELLPLMQKAIQQKLSPKEIKKSIQYWKEDSNRV